MSRKSLFLGIGILVLFVSVGVGIVALLVSREPQFYHAVALPPGSERTQRSQEFISALANLMGGSMKNDSDDQWHFELHQDQINSYFDEDFVRQKAADKILPDGISAPRMAIEPDKIRLGFRYGRAPWNTIISMNLGVWLARGEPNAVALEIRGLRAGALPFSAQSMMQQLSQKVLERLSAERDLSRVVEDQRSIRVNWYRHNGNPVALLRFQADQPRPSFRITSLELRPEGVIDIRGRYTDSLAAAKPGPKVFNRDAFLENNFLALGLR